ncbi:MAG: winged helix-turn-helix transcriptional regulator [Thermoplasmata archaeon]|nr:winged helix-turn-helix transcriptional regulator [Thermoplasmata archaeon]
MNEDLLALETRRKIYTLIEEKPGLHKREIARTMGMSLSTIDYHLHYMEKKGLVEARTDGKYKRYFVKEKGGKEDRRIFSMLRQEVPRRILLFLLAHPRAIHKEICEHIGKAPSTISFHMKKLVKEGLVEEISMGKEKAYFVRNEARVIELLIKYKESFVDKAVDRFIDAWAGFGKR